MLLRKFVDEVYADLVNGEELSNLLILINQSLLAGAGTASKQHEEILQVNAKLLDATAQLIFKGQQLGDFRSGDAHEMAVFF